MDELGERPLRALSEGRPTRDAQPANDWLAAGGTLPALHGRILRGGPVGLGRLRAHVGTPTGAGP